MKIIEPFKTFDRVPVPTGFSKPMSIADNSGITARVISSADRTAANMARTAASAARTAATDTYVDTREEALAAYSKAQLAQASAENAQNDAAFGSSRDAVVEARETSDFKRSEVERIQQALARVPGGFSRSKAGETITSLNAEYLRLDGVIARGTTHQSGRYERQPAFPGGGGRSGDFIQVFIPGSTIYSAAARTAQRQQVEVLRRRNYLNRAAKRLEVVTAEIAAENAERLSEDQEALAETADITLTNSKITAEKARRAAALAESLANNTAVKFAARKAARDARQTTRAAARTLRAERAAARAQPPTAQELLDAKADAALEEIDAASELADIIESNADTRVSNQRPDAPLILPPITDHNILHATNLLEDDYAKWLFGLKYARGDYVISKDTHRIYRSLTSKNVGNDPDIEYAALTDPLQDDPDTTHWQFISATNLWKLFDQKPSVQCTNDNIISVSISCTDPLPALSFFNLTAQYLDISITTFENEISTLIYESRRTLNDGSLVVDWLSYFTAPVKTLSEFHITNLPILYEKAIIKIDIIKSMSIAGCGQIVLGRLTEMGFAKIGSSGFSGLDFSSVILDDYGTLDTVVRAASKVAQFDVVVPTSQLLSLDATLQGFRGGKPAVWLSGDDPKNSGAIYGFYRDYSVTYATGGRSYLNLEIQGVV